MSAASLVISSGCSSLAAILNIVLASAAVILPSAFVSPFIINVYSLPLKINFMPLKTLSIFSPATDTAPLNITLKSSRVMPLLSFGRIETFLLSSSILPSTSAFSANSSFSSAFVDGSVGFAVVVSVGFAVVTSVGFAVVVSAVFAVVVSAISAVVSACFAVVVSADFAVVVSAAFTVVVSAFFAVVVSAGFTVVVSTIFSVVVSAAFAVVVSAAFAVVVSAAFAVVVSADFTVVVSAVFLVVVSAGL